MNLKPDFQARLSQVKLLALDVDGVLTDGGLYYTESGEELKKFNVKDGLGIKLVMQAGIEVAVITTSTSVAVVHRAKKLGIKHTFIGIEDKLTVLKKLCEDLNLSLAQVAYVGDDIVDLPVMQAVGCPITVGDAMPQNQACALYVTKLTGGHGCVREICDILVAEITSHSKNV
ncbi:HAD-IIIA family hydrolase [Aetokthonos hydrillicola Thurmond2011]|jgi:3-deoxy-D-manno-octulosonate 8-phosphate phosphatase (KDO 8-P phosphatase)|uniref:HAD-IIIA family hydrolase n=1 Tax=Aetokthonos hydrillicola Thurmond2011 TaxID=2712845 RepID=A0AAP5M738_9CYAN|nr:HAD-IIIA family hydrolase [Aetokthonos hydrillicola]MBO3457608.1 HAD-IIIA family hydrolase [Aetokthonos hydrillicola CCALA 1050]MBW4587886.1 HAD-IIIA family hydrolase [Aetokthonos hydrillicola CCALA 1050]MDR9894710.1 HAD-IIIA family hydrolase [Aetokthonos hydrillicola Thurmond2011]